MIKKSHGVRRGFLPPQRGIFVLLRGRYNRKCGHPSQAEGHTDNAVTSLSGLFTSPSYRYRYP